ncbi:hypothetical protein STENM36S_03399 [Streptomyces tendae]
MRELGGLNILVNNACTPQQPDRPLAARLRAKPASQERTCTPTTTWYRPRARTYGGDAIIATASEEALRGSDTMLDYAASKAALVEFAESIAQHLAKDGIRANVVAPGPTWTVLNVADPNMPQEGLAHLGSEGPLGRVAQPEEIAPTYVHLASDADSSSPSARSSPSPGASPPPTDRRAGRARCWAASSSRSVGARRAKRCGLVLGPYLCEPAATLGEGDPDARRGRLGRAFSRFDARAVAPLRSPPTSVSAVARQASARTAPRRSALRAPRAFRPRGVRGVYHPLDRRPHPPVCPLAFRERQPPFHGEPSPPTTG